MNELSKYSVWEIAEAWVLKKLSDDALTDLQAKMQADLNFKNKIEEAAQLIQSVHAQGRQKRFRALLKDIQTQKTNTKTNWISQSKKFILKNWKPSAVAASVAIAASIITYGTMHTATKSTQQYTVLKREIEDIKNSQKKIISDINVHKPAAPAIQSSSTGTGFALSNDGLLVTNYHVTEEADSIYIQTGKGEFYKAHLIAFDAKSDLALLKVSDEDFKFANSEVPYSIANSKVSLGSKVFTLGYPQDEIVYNEGYVSAANGFQGDSNQYRLVLPANPGQSGSPVIDRKGKLIAIVTGKEVDNNGGTFAVSSKSLINLVKNIPAGNEVRLPKTNNLYGQNREQQVALMQQFTCMVRVYK